MKEPREKITVLEVERRLKATLAGAFAAGPTQLKDIPKKALQKKTKPRGAI